MLEALFAFVRGVWRVLWGALRAFGRWLGKKRSEAQWWRIGCLTAACLCAYLAVLTGNVRAERDIAVQQLASVQTTIRDIPTVVDKASKAAAATAKAECARDNAEAIAKSQTHARAVEQLLAAAQAELASRNAKEKADAKRKGDALAAGVRAGTVQLRDEWNSRAFNVSGLASGPGGPDDAADLRATGYGRVREIGASCDADIRYWQGIWKETAGKVK